MHAQTHARMHTRTHTQRADYRSLCVVKSIDLNDQNDRITWQHNYIHNFTDLFGHAFTTMLCIKGAMIMTFAVSTMEKLDVVQLQNCGGYGKSILHHNVLPYHDNNVLQVDHFC